MARNPTKFISKFHKIILINLNPILNNFCTKCIL